MADYGGGSEPRYPCKVCGRQFFKESLAKHEGVCARNASKKRKVFDSTKQRAAGTELSYRQMKQAQKKDVPPPRSSWRAQHEDFINTVRAARGVSKALAEGGPLPPPPPPSINPDYVQCPYCSRRFNQQAAERHINFCKEQSQRINSRPPPNAAAKAKQATRLQYQAPKPKVRGAPTAGSPAGSGSNINITGPAARGPAGSTRPGVGMPASRGRAGSYQPLSVAGARAGSLSNYSKNAAAAAAAPAYEYDVNFRSTAAISTTSSPICTPVTAEGGGHHGSFAYNPHPKLSDIRHRGTGRDTSTGNTGQHARGIGRDTSTGNAGQHARGIGSLSGEADRYCSPAAVLSTREALFGNTSRREPAYADDFCINSREQSPDYDENSYLSAREYRYSSQPRERNKTQSNRRQGQSHLTSAGTQSTPWPKFCHECGSWYPVATAKFCCDCGTRRLTLPREGI